MPRFGTATCLAGLVACLAAAGGSGAAAAPPPVRVGLVVDASDAGARETADALRASLRSATPGGRPIEWLERAAIDDDAALRMELLDIVREGSQVVVAVGARAAGAAPDSVRDRPVVAVSADGAGPDGSRGGRVHAVAWTLDARRVAEETLRIGPSARRVAVAGPAGAAADALTAVLSARGISSAAVERVTRPPGADYLDAAAGGADLVLAAPEAGPAVVTDLVRAFAGRGVAVVGTRADHLDAGAAVVLRTAPVDVGGLAASALLDALAERRANDPPRRPHRLVREVHLTNARRLGFPVPLAILAASDRTVAPTPGRR